MLQITTAQTFDEALDELIDGFLEADEMTGEKSATPEEVVASLYMKAESLVLYAEDTLRDDLEDQ